MPKRRRRYREKLRRHFNLRLSQYYETKVNKEEMKEIIRMITDGHVIFLGRASNTRSFFIVEYKSKSILLLYSKKLKALVTAYPLDAIENVKRKINRVRLANLG